MGKFECKGCGVCCSERSIDETPKDMYPSFSKNSYVFYCCKPTLTLFDWEAKELSEAAEQKGINVDIVPFRVIYDMSKRQTIVLQYTLKEKKCPLLKDSKCCAYDKRPLICKLYPVQIGGVVDLMRGKNEIKYSICPNDEFDPAILTGKNIGVKELVKMMHDRYGDSYLALLERDLALKETTGWMNALVSQGKISPAKPNLDSKEVLRMVESSEGIPLTDYIKNNTSIDADDFIQQTKQCAHGRLLIKNIMEKEISKR